MYRLLLQGRGSNLKIGGYSAAKFNNYNNNNSNQILLPSSCACNNNSNSNNNHFVSTTTTTGNSNKPSFFHTTTIKNRMRDDDDYAKFEEFMRKNQQSHHRKNNNNNNGSPFLPPNRTTLLGTLTGLVWKIVMLPLKIVVSILMLGALFVGKIIFKRKLKEMEQMMAKTTLRNVRPLNTMYRKDKLTEGQIFFMMDQMAPGQPPMMIDEVLEDCLNFMDNNQFVYERLKEESIKKSDSLKQSFSISLHDSKEKVARDNGESTTKMCFSTSKFIRLVTDPQMMSTRQSSAAATSNTIMIRRVPIFIMVKMSDKEIEQMKNVKPMMMMRGMGGGNDSINIEENEILKEYKLILPLFLDIHASYEFGEWRQFKKLDILTAEEAEEEVLISFDELSFESHGSSMNVGIMDAEFVEKK